MRRGFRLDKKVRKFRIWWYRAVLSENPECLRRATINQPTLACGAGRISIGCDVAFGWRYSPFFYSGYNHLEARFPTARVEIGAGAFFNNSCTLIANTTYIKIGRDCRIGYCCSFFDSDFHGLHPSERDIPGDALPDAPVNIGDNVFLGSNVTVLKGVSIGHGSIIGAGSVVSKSIPPMTIAAGNPCRVIRQIADADRIHCAVRR